MLETSQNEQIEALIKQNAEFRSLYYLHRELDNKVRDAELGVLPVDDATLQNLKKENFGPRIVSPICGKHRTLLSVINFSTRLNSFENTILQKQ